RHPEPTHHERSISYTGGYTRQLRSPSYSRPFPTHQLQIRSLRPHHMSRDRCRKVLEPHQI
ncbi:hypothetical protein LTR16_004406, partial [Cryomyces antarcticus]